MSSEQILQIRCSKCKIFQSSSAFSPQKNKKNGLSSWCKSCMAEKANKRREDYPEKILAYKASDSAKAIYRTWCEVNKEHLKETGRIRMAGWRSKNGEKERARNRAIYHADIEKARAKARAERKANLSGHAAYQRTRRARRNNAPFNNLTHLQWVEIQASQDHRCAYCGVRAKGRLTQDHITPLSKGGSHTLSNVVAACKNCNSRKGNRPVLSPVQPLLLTIAPSKPYKTRN